MEKILFLTSLDFYGKRIAEHHVEVFNPFKPIWSILKVFRIIHLNSNLKYKHIWYIKFPDLNAYDIIIISANEFSVSLTTHLKEKVKSPVIRLIYWYWNPVKPKYDPSLISNDWEKWTFDKEDSHKYKMKYNGTYYFPIQSFYQKTPENDVFFIGLDKGRYKELMKLQAKFEALGLTTDFHIVNEKKKVELKKEYKPKIDYEKVIEKINNSKAILEVMQNNQTGLTLRTMESLNYSKKLITTNASIKNYNFYRKENIFILDVDDIKDLTIFLNTPYLSLPSYVVEQYHFEEWKNRLINNQELDDNIKENIHK
jgi:hypothetical protein